MEEVEIAASTVGGPSKFFFFAFFRFLCRVFARCLAFACFGARFKLASRHEIEVGAVFAGFVDGDRALDFTVR